MVMSLPASRTARLSLPRLEAAGLSDAGLQRPANEDAYVVAPSVGLFAVADGVGGHAAGDVASRMAISVVLDTVEDAAALWPEELGAALLAGAVADANAAVHAAGYGEATHGMATTFTGLLMLPDRAVIAHVGDSRAYLLRGRELRQLTEDHSLVNAYVQSGLMTAAQAATSRHRNVILRGLGLEETVKVDVRFSSVAPGDVFLLASDGLHGVLTDEEIASVLLAERDLERAAAELVACANDAGGPDNVTVVLVRAR